MKFTRLIALAVIAATCGLGAAQAKTLRDTGQPAEFPPSSYTGRQYVDSKGCVFVRAGIDGDVTWIPRVSRARKTLCGQQPSLATARAPEPAAASAPQPRQSAVAAAPAPRAAPVQTARAQPVQAQPARIQPAQTRRVQSQPVRTQPVRAPQGAAISARPQPAAPMRTVSAPRTAPVLSVGPAPVRRAPVQQPRVAASSGCVGGSAVSSQYMQSRSGYPVRCGPQAGAHVTRVPGTNAARVAPRPAQAPAYTAPAYTAPLYGGTGYAAEARYVPRTVAAAPQARIVDPYTTRVAPRHVVRSQQRTQDVTIPDGYKRVWMDDRLSQQRAHQTFAGKAAMERMWTKTLPRRLILTGSGREVTALYPGLIYPYVSYEEQRAAMSGQAYRAQSGAAVSGSKVTVSTKSRQPAAAPAARATSHRYVQAGVYANRAQAQQAAQRLAGAGLPARLGQITSGGRQYDMVLSGPYSNQAALNGALAQARRAGFGNAKLR
ncbi:SPOR domain-containing protein [Roseovarius dicentrarchi]|uniref:SPOR domain-containing protein n=1 Tax=Roseovarius dicentrarchi TaxID=2250573 RepID=UPI000DE9BA00|nr:SPOR domain-containing protein [Roseovarius dicentrarchi]